ncbi:MAG: glycosyltransferase family 4 protein [Candidatus Cloacimonetes bacterium]|nr:glycosyltransferase family 4 protein [Candidatus Cloacimonadota bacterium]
MKILYLVHQFYPEYQSGTEKFVFNSAYMAQKNGNKVKVVTYSFYDNSFYSNESEGILSQEFNYKGIPVIAIKQIKPPHDLHYSMDDELLYAIGKKILLTEAPDIIHVGHAMRMHAFIKAAIDMHIPYIMTLTDFFLLCPKVNLAPNMKSLCSGPDKGTACQLLCPEFSEAYITKRLVTAKLLLAHAKAIISPSQFLAKIFIQEFDKLKIDIINHGISYKSLRKNRRFYTNETPIVFGYAGYLSFHKGVHILLKAFTSIKDENIKLFVYGPMLEPYINQLQHIANNDKRIIFKGPYSSDNIGEVFTNIDVLITPSICYESYQMVLHEGLASDVPIIASDLGAMSDKIKNNFNGFKFAAGDHEELQEKIEMIINNRTQLNILKENIISKMIIPTIEQEAYNYYRLYTKIVK